MMVDIQNDYFPKGKLKNVGAVEASFAAQKRLSHFREKRLPVIHVQHILIPPPLFQISAILYITEATYHETGVNSMSDTPPGLE
jgi:nicotinamidase-related amidase